MNSVLTQKEIDIIQLIADGEDYLTVAKKMQLNYVYTRRVVAKIRAKMHCETTYNVIATAVRQGIID